MEKIKKENSSFCRKALSEVIFSQMLDQKKNIYSEKIYILPTKKYCSREIILVSNENSYVDKNITFKKLSLKIYFDVTINS